MVEEVIEALPPSFAEFIQHTPVVVDDAPSGEMLRELEHDAGEPIAADELCGLHTGVPNPDQSVSDDARLPSYIHLFRVGILAVSGGWDQTDGDDEVYSEIMITLLHEIGHQMGLDEDDLEELGYA